METSAQTEASVVQVPPTDDKNYKWKVMSAVIFGTFMVILDSTAVNVAVPTFQKEFNVQVDQVNAVLTAYILALGIVTPLAGWLACLRKPCVGALDPWVPGAVYLSSK